MREWGRGDKCASSEQTDPIAKWFIRMAVIVEFEALRFLRDIADYRLVDFL